ncbi:MAG: BatA and WFA domain-containing protein [Planctomycetes bacterium]|nr:BatA and WFA domain-containing protein [Planctomycetota bacterium]
MVLSHPFVLLGIALVAIPVILHLLMRAKPKKLLFPALRLIQNRKRTNTRRMRLRHLGLLLLRMLAISLLALALARPALPAADYALNRGDWLRLLFVAGTCAGIYFGLTSLWKRRQTPHHEFTYRRSMLRGGVALGALLGLLLLVAWPYQRRIAAAITQPTVTSDETLPVAAVMLFDTSLSMGYRLENKTRLEAAQDIAIKQIGNMPRLSRVALCETAGDAPIRFSSDLGGVSKRIAAITPQLLNRPLDDRLLAALEGHGGDRDQNRSGESTAAPDDEHEGLLREVYIFTDLASSAWRKDNLPRLRETLNQMPNVGVYLIDVGVLKPSNIAITELELSDQTLPVGSPLELRVTVSAVGVEPGDRVVELWVDSGTEKLVKLDQSSVKIDPDTAVTVTFSRQVPAGPVVQGEVRLVSSDPLSFDDVRYFSVLVQPPSEVLIVCDQPSDAVYLLNVLAPEELATQGESRHKCRVINTALLPRSDLSKYAVVCLVDVADPQAAGWQALEKFASGGGGVAIYLGENVRHEKYLTPEALAVFPGKLKGKVPFDDQVFLDLQNVSHPILKKFADWGGGLSDVEINRCWSVDPELVAGAIVSYTDRKHLPALLERSLGRGRVIALTTAIDRRGSWNDLPLYWGFAPLSYETMRYLSRTSQSQFNYTAGEDILLPINGVQPFPAYRLRKPGLQQLNEDVPAGTANLVVKGIDQLGNYRLTAIESDVKFERGFSVNPVMDESRIDRLSKDDFDARFGAERYSIARDLESLQRNVKTGRLGREAFPLVVLILLVVFVGENFVANRFYDNEQAP